MRLYTYIHVGILFILLNSSLSFGASTYLFGDGSCSTLTGTHWQPLGKRCPRTLIHSLKDPKNIFCQYRLKPGDNLKTVLIKNGFYRSKERVAVVDYSNGRASKAINSKFEYLLLSKKDLLSKNNYFCTMPNPATLKKSAFALHIPNSLYIIKSGLKKINDETLFIEKETLTKKAVPVESVPPAKATKIKTIKTTGVLSLTPIFFYEKFKGTQISNGTTAEISSKLSPGVHARIDFRKHRNWQYSIFTGVDFHIYNERAGTLIIANNNVQAIHLGGAMKIAYNKFFQPKLSAQMLEDLFYSRQSSTTLGIERELVSRFSLSSEIFFHNSSSLQISLSPTVVYDLAQTELEEGFGYSAPLSLRFSQDTYSWGIDLNYSVMTKDLVDLELERSVVSFSAYMGFKF